MRTLTVAPEAFGNYQLIKRIAAGGMAEIFLARDLGSDDPDERLVIKRILPHLSHDLEIIRMFLDEARIAARLGHPNIVQIFNLGLQKESYFIAMEYIAGTDVRRMWKKADSVDQRIPLGVTCRIVLEACRGLDYAHKKAGKDGKPLGIIHRDVSPQNLLVGFDGTVKVADFGIAKAADQSTQTRVGMLKGKVSYMSPEQATGRTIDARSDIFSIGIVFHELLAGIRLFKGSELPTLKAIAECKISHPSEANPDVPPELDLLAMKAVAKRPKDRFQEAKELADAIEHWLEAHPQGSRKEDLAAFMRKIYPDGAATEPEPPKPRPSSPSNDKAHGSATRVDRRLATPPSKPRPERPPPAPIEPNTGFSQLLEANPQLWVGIGSFALLGLLALLYLGFSSAGPKVDLTVRSHPPGANLFVDGVPIGKTPTQVRVDPKSAAGIRLELPGYRPLRLKLDVGEDPNQELDLSLQRKAAGSP